MRSAPIPQSSHHFPRLNQAPSVEFPDEPPCGPPAGGAPVGFAPDGGVPGGLPPWGPPLKPPWPPKPPGGVPVGGVPVKLPVGIGGGVPSGEKAALEPDAASGAGAGEARARPERTARRRELVTFIFLVLKVGLVGGFVICGILRGGL